MLKTNSTKDNATNLSKLNPLNHLKRIDDLRRLANSGTSGSGWYQRRKSAVKKLAKLSKETIILTGLYYRTDKDQHEMTHIRCGNRFKMSLNDLSQVVDCDSENGSKTCPFCHPNALHRIGSVDTVSEYVQSISQGRAYFIRNQLLASAACTYRFYCLNCREVYQTTFTNFHNNAGDSNGCSKCLAKQDTQL